LALVRLKTTALLTMLLVTTEIQPPLLGKHALVVKGDQRATQLLDQAVARTARVETRKDQETLETPARGQHLHLLTQPRFMQATRVARRALHLLDILLAVARALM